MSRDGRSDRGDSLIEILVALSILGIGVTALVSALGVMATTTTTNRSHAQVETALLSMGEFVKTMPLTASQWASCGPARFNVTSQVALPPGVTASVGQGTTAPGASSCSQLIQIPVRVQGDGFDLSLSVVRRP